MRYITTVLKSVFRSITCDSFGVTVLFVTPVCCQSPVLFKYYFSVFLPTSCVSQQCFCDIHGDLFSSLARREFIFSLDTETSTEPRIRLSRDALTLGTRSFLV